MSVRNAIYDLLNDTEADAYPLVAPQETTDPYIAYNMRSMPVRIQGGITVTEVDLTLEIYASTLDQCITLADAMYAGLEGVNGTYATETLMICNWVSESDGYVPTLDKFNITQEYSLKFE